MAYSVINTYIMLDSGFTFTAILTSLFTSSLYVFIQKNNRHILYILPVSRLKMILADYMALLTILMLNNIILVSTYYGLASMLSNPNFEHPLNTILGVSFLALANSLIFKCSYDYFWSFGTKGGIITISIVALVFVIVTFFILVITELFGATANIFLYGFGIVLMLIIFLVTKRYYLRLDL
jgi:hypothetical protein